MNAISDSSESPPDEATVGGSSALEVPLAIPPSPAPCSESKEHLAVPLYVPSRTSSPGSLSVLSLDEWQMLNGTGKHGPTSHLSTWRLKFEKFWVRNLGLFYMLLAQVFGTAMNVTTRFLEVQGNKGKGMDPFQVLFARMGITVVLATAYMTYKKTPYFPFGMPEVRWLLVARGMGGFFGVFGMYYSLQYLPISDATVLTYLARGLTCWACSFLINEPFSRIEKIGTFISLGGVIFIARPTSLISFGSTDSQATHPGAGNSTHTGDASDFDSITPHERIKAVGVAMIGVLGAVAAYTTIRWIGKRAHPLISVNYFATWCTLVSLVMQIAVPSIGFLFPADLKEWALLIFLGSCGFIMQFLLAAGLSYEKSSRATNMTYTSMLFALASDKIFFGASPGLSSIIGSTLILGAAIVMALQKAQPVDEVKEGVEGRADEERGLMSNIEGALPPEESRMPIQEVQLRALR